MERSIGGAKDQFNRNYKHCGAASLAIVVDVDLLESSMLLTQLHFKLPLRCTPAPYGILATS